MKDKKPLVMWIHGFAGKADNETFLEMRKKYPMYDWFSIEVDHHAKASMAKINQYIRENDVSIVAGTSLGGFFAMCSETDVPKLVVNPVTDPVRDLRQFVGMNSYKPGRSDGQTDFLFTEEMLNEFAELRIGSLDKTLCHYAEHDQILGDDIKLDYERMFIHREMIDETLLNGHFLSFKYVKKKLSDALAFIEVTHEIGMMTDTTKFHTPL